MKKTTHLPSYTVQPALSTPLTLTFSKEDKGAISLADRFEGLFDVGSDQQFSLQIMCTIEAGAQITLIDDSERLGLQNLEVVIELLENSSLIYRSHVIDSHRTSLAEMPLTSNVKASGERLRKKLHFILNGVGATLDVQCSYLGGKKRDFRITTIQDHRAPQTKSELSVKGVFEGEAHFWCDSTITIAKPAQKTDALQVNKNLLLSETARAISIPKMEVEADDVSCQHGAATSQISEDQLFYLQSRGLSVQKAQELLIQAFLAH